MYLCPRACEPCPHTDDPCAEWCEAVGALGELLVCEQCGLPAEADPSFDLSLCGACARQRD